jgi:tape measure domain-containing protein
MAITLGLLEIVMRTDLDQFTGGMRTASQVVDQTSARMTRAVSGATDSVTNLERTLGGFRGGNAFQALTISALRAEDGLSRLRNVALLLPAALGGVGAAAGSKALMDYADQATTVRNRLAVLTEQQSQRVAMEREVFEIAQRTRSSYVATSQLFSRTTQAAQQLGRSQGEVGRFVETVSMTSQISGSSTQEANAAAVQLAQGLSSNRLQGDELRSILENNVALAQLLARELAGGSVGRLREMGTEGLLTAQQVMDAVLRGSSEIRRQFEQTQATFANSFVIVNNALTRYVGQLDQAVGASQAFFNLMQSLADNLPQIAGGIALITAALVALGAVKVAGALVGAVASARNAGNEGLAKALEQARGRLVALESEKNAAASVAASARSEASRAATGQSLSVVSQNDRSAYLAATSALNRAETELINNRQKLERLEERRADIAARVAAAESAATAQGVANSRTLLREKEALIKAERDIASATRAIDRTNARLPELRAAPGVQIANTNLENAATAERARLATVAAQANRDLAVATHEVARATQQVSTATADANNKVGVMSGMATAARGVFGSLYSFLGGPWGVALTVATVAMTALGLSHANAAVRAREQEEALSRLATTQERVATAQRRASVGGGVDQNVVLQARRDLEQAREAITGRSGVALGDLFAENGGEQRFLRVRGILSASGANLPDLRRRGVPQAIKDTEAATASASPEALRAISAEIERMGIAGEITATRALTLADAFRNLADAAERVRQISSMTRSIDSVTDRFRTMNEGDLSVYLQQANELQAKTRQYAEAVNTARAAAEQAQPKLRELAQAMTEGLSQGGAGINAAERAGFTTQAQTQIEAFLKSTMALRGAASGIEVDEVTRLVNEFVQGSVTVDDFRLRLTAISAANPALEGVNRLMGDQATEADRARKAIEEIQSALQRLSGSTATVRILTESREVALGNNTAEVERQATRLREEIVRNNGRERGGRSALLRQNRESVNREFAAALAAEKVTEADLNRLAESRTPQERRQRAAARSTEERWTPEERVTRELSDALAVAGNRMGRLDEETLRYARSARLADEEQRKFIDAVTSGNLDAAPEKFKRIREQVEAIARARLNTDLTNERSDMFLDPTEQKVTQRLRAAGLSEATAPMEASQIRLNEQLSQTKGLFNDAFSGIGQQILQGASAADILAGSLQRVQGKLLKIAEDWVAMQAFKGIMGLFGFATGGGGSGFPQLYHDGGVAGSSFWGSRSGYRGQVVQAHSGMGPNEIPAILERGEAVLSRQMTNALPGTMSGLTALASGAGAPPVVEVNVITPPGTSARTTKREGSNGGSVIDVFVEQVEGAIAGNLSNGRGALGPAMEGTYGLGRRGS